MDIVQTSEPKKCLHKRKREKKKSKRDSLGFFLFQKLTNTQNLQNKRERERLSDWWNLLKCPIRKILIFNGNSSSNHSFNIQPLCLFFHMTNNNKYFKVQIFYLSHSLAFPFISSGCDEKSEEAKARVVHRWKGFRNNVKYAKIKGHKQIFFVKSQFISN